MDTIARLIKKLPLALRWQTTQSATHPGVCCISLTDHDFSLSYITRKNNQISLSLCETTACDAKHFPQVLAQWVKEYQLKNTACVWMLQPDQYHLFSLEELPVTEAEFQSAIRWNIKKLLPFPIDDAVIDRFAVPPLKVTNPKKIITAVVAQASYLQPLINAVKTSGMVLASITIPEMALTRINALFEEDEMSTALIYLNENSSTLIITRQKEFYLSRHLNWGLNALIEVAHDIDKTHTSLDKLALEVQRTFDYFQSQWRYPAPTRVFSAPISAVDPEFSIYLSNRLGVLIQELDLNKVFANAQQWPLTLQNRCLSTIGGALSLEAKDYAAD